MPINYSEIDRASFVIDEALLLENLNLMKKVQADASINIILALKGFATWSFFPQIHKYLKGATASSYNEARLIYKEMGVRAHTYSPAYHEDEFKAILKYSSHLTFNSLSQFNHFKERVQNSKYEVSMGIRVNPGWSDVETDLYNPCANGSRLGEPIENFTDGFPKELEGIHFHALCESNSYSLEKCLASFEEKFGAYLPQLKWVNMGGGHLMTKKGYDIEHLVKILTEFKLRYPNLEVILEPGSAVVWETGVLVAHVMDIVSHQGISTAILDVSFTCHMPDTLEMPYRPRIETAVEKHSDSFDYRLGGMSCLAGDFMFEYSFDKPLEIGSQLILMDMAHYTIVKTTMFNGVRHPDIGVWTKDNKYKLIRRFTYKDYKKRLS